MKPCSTSFGISFGAPSLGAEDPELLPEAHVGVGGKYRAGVGCMVDSCMQCDSYTQGGYPTNIVVRYHFAVHIPDRMLATC